MRIAGRVATGSVARESAAFDVVLDGGLDVRVEVTAQTRWLHGPVRGDGSPGSPLVVVGDAASQFDEASGGFRDAPAATHVVHARSVAVGPVADVLMDRAVAAASDEVPWPDVPYGMSVWWEDTRAGRRLLIQCRRRGARQVRRLTIDADVKMRWWRGRWAVPLSAVREIRALKGAWSGGPAAVELQCDGERRYSFDGLDNEQAELAVRLLERVLLDGVDQWVEGVAKRRDSRAKRVLLNAVATVIVLACAWGGSILVAPTCPLTCHNSDVQHGLRVAERCPLVTGQLGKHLTWAMGFGASHYHSRDYNVWLNIKGERARGSMSVEVGRGWRSVSVDVPDGSINATKCRWINHRRRRNTSRRRR